MKYSVGQKGQVVIAKKIRDRLGVKPGWITLQRLVGDRVELYFLPPEHTESLKGSLKGYLQTSLPNQEDLDQARSQAWQDAIQGS